MFSEVISLVTGWLHWHNWRNRIEVGILFVAIFLFLHYLRGTRGERIIRSLGLILVTLVVGLVQLVRFFELPNLEYLLDAVVNTLLIAVLIIFHPELRRGLIRMGSRNPFLREGLTEASVVELISEAAERLSKVKVGALIAIERTTGLKTVAETGTGIDSEMSVGLLSTIFFPGTALHDGAVVVQAGRIAAAGCLLPLSDNMEISKLLGTRHRAAVGLTEETDAVVVVVSEETGAISLAVNGQLERPLDPEQLTEKLRFHLFEEAPPSVAMETSTGGDA